MQPVPDLLIQDDALAIRRMRDDEQDYEVMAKWLSDERVLEFYAGRDNPFPSRDSFDRPGAMCGPRWCSYHRC